MSVFQSFRYWLRTAPGAERKAGALAGLLVAALLGMLLVPGGSGGDDALTASLGSTATAGSGTGTPASSGSDTAPGMGSSEPSPDTNPVATGDNTAGDNTPGESAAAVNGGDEGDGGPPAAESAPSTGCTSPPGSAPGITDSEIRVAVMLTEIAGPFANSTFGVPTVPEQQAAFDAVIDDANAKGGVACRALVPRYYVVNPALQNDLHAKCLAAAEAEPFAVLDGGGATGPMATGAVCYAQRGLPFFAGANMLAQEQVEQFAPYLFAPNTTYDTLARNTVFALRDSGFFERGAKVGVLHSSCQPEITKKYFGWLQEAGVARDSLDSYDFGCNLSTPPSPAQFQQAVLQFRRNGITHVTAVAFGASIADFSSTAEQQGYRPRYGIPDEVVVIGSEGVQRPNAQNFDGALAVTSMRVGEHHTPDLSPHGATQACDAILTAAGQPTAWEQSAGGNSCGEVWMFKAAVEAAPELSREALAAGLQAVGALDLPFPYGPADFSGALPTVAGKSWRMVRYAADCACWRVADPVFRPSF